MNKIKHNHTNTNYKQSCSVFTSRLKLCTTVFKPILEKYPLLIVVLVFFPKYLFSLTLNSIQKIFSYNNLIYQVSNNNMQSEIIAFILHIWKLHLEIVYKCFTTCLTNTRVSWLNKAPSYICSINSSILCKFSFIKKHCSCFRWNWKKRKWRKKYCLTRLLLMQVTLSTVREASC